MTAVVNDPRQERNRNPPIGDGGRVLLFSQIEFQFKTVRGAIGGFGVEYFLKHLFQQTVAGGRGGGVIGFCS